MCGKFTAMNSWAEVVDFSQPLSAKEGDEAFTFRPMSLLPVIVWDKEEGRRRVVRMRWGFPLRSNPMRPDPIHVRAETIDEKPTFKDAFLDGQRGIVVVRTFNEGKELSPSKTEQHTITPGGEPLGIAFLWRRFEIPGLPAPFLACVMATVPANPLISSITDRMPAVLAAEDWKTWLGEVPASPDEAKACLMTVEDVRWTMNKEEKAAQAKKEKRKPTVREPTRGLF